MEYSKNAAYQQAVQFLLERMEQDGELPWRRPWKVLNRKYANAVTQRPYSGFNRLVLAMMPFGSPHYVTRAQVEEVGGRIRDREKGVDVVFWLPSFRQKARAPSLPEETPEAPQRSTTRRSVPLLRVHRVYNIEQCDGIEKITEKLPADPELKPLAREERLAKLEQMLASTDMCPVLHGGNEASYDPVRDVIHMPHRDQFETEEKYLASRVHETIHATGSHKRLGRFAEGCWARFGSPKYAMEELTAEIGVSMVFAAAETELQSVDNSAAYVRHWCSKIKDDPSMLVTAAQRAEKAANWVFGIYPGVDVQPLAAAPEPTAPAPSADEGPLSVEEAVAKVDRIVPPEFGGVDR